MFLKKVFSLYSGISPELNFLFPRSYEILATSYAQEFYSATF